MDLVYQRNSVNPRSNAYQILKKLGEGTYGNVFLTELHDATRGRDTYTTEPVKTMACKVIDTKKMSRDYLVKFIPRELEILRKISHPHIIQIHGIYKSDSRYLIFMRYAENGDLVDFSLKTGAILENQARLWTKQISLAVQYLHELEIAHRDIKCENILVTANFNVKLADFGFARYVLSKKGRRMLSETFCGSQSYSAPEILKGIPYNPKIADIWSLGVVIFVMMNRALPFDGVTIKKLYEQQINKRWKFKTSVEPSVSAEVKDLMVNMLEPNVEKRYTISEVLNSEWIYMDRRLLGLSEGESLALASAKAERRKMDERFLLPNYQGIKKEKTDKYPFKY